MSDKIVAEAHVYITLTCLVCGYEWEIEDYDSDSVSQAVSDAEDEESCPKCSGEL